MKKILDTKFSKGIVIKEKDIINRREGLNKIRSKSFWKIEDFTN